MSKGGDTGSLWERLRALAYDFRVAAWTKRSKEAEHLSVILHALEKSAEFRKVAFREARKHIAKQTGRPKPTLGSEARALLEGVELAIAVDPDPVQVARSIVGFAVASPTLYLRAPGLPDPSGEEPDWDAHTAATSAVAGAIRPKLADPDDVDTEAVIRAGLRALGADDNDVRNLFQGS